MLKKSLAIVAVVLLPMVALGQGYRPAGYPAYPTPYGGGFYPGRQGGAMYGAADVMRAQGENWNQAEEARILREKANQEKLVTRRKAFDEAAYEKTNTPSFVEKTAASDVKMFQRVVLNPTSYEISSGEALNIMLPHLDRMVQQGTYGPAPPVSPAELDLINTVSPGQSGMAMMSDVKNIPWPIALLGKKQEKLTNSMEMAVASIQAKGRVDLKLYTACQTEFKDLRVELDKNFDEEKINMSRFAEGSTFMTSLNKEVVALGTVSAAKVLARPNHPRGHDVLEVLGFMITNGLKFAPSKPGDESAYAALHASMAVFARSAQLASAVTSDPTLRVITQPIPKK